MLLRAVLDYADVGGFLLLTEPDLHGSTPQRYSDKNSLTSHLMKAKDLTFPCSALLLGKVLGFYQLLLL